MEQKFLAFVMVLMGLFNLGCFSNDDYLIYPSVTIADAFIFENAQNYQVGDTITYSLEFSRYLPEEGYDNLLDILETSQSTEFYFRVSITKFSAFSNGYVSFPIDEAYYFSPDGKTSIAIYDEATETYRATMALVLVEEGEYKLNFNYADMDSRYTLGGVSVSIIHISETNPEGHLFTVTSN